MQSTVSQAANASAEIAAAANGTYDQIRLLTLGLNTVSDDPLLQLGSILQPWTPASPSSVGSGNWSAFSALCWFFVRDLYRELHVPLGALSINWALSPVEVRVRAHCNAVIIRIKEMATHVIDVWFPFLA